MDIVYYLATCDTCRKIIKALPANQLKFRDIRQEAISEQELDRMQSLAGSYEALFSRKAQLYKSLGLKSKELSEDEYKSYILQHYTFLSRPVFIIGDSIYIGNSPKNVAAAIDALQQ